MIWLLMFRREEPAIMFDKGIMSEKELNIFSSRRAFLAGSAGFLGLSAVGRLWGMDALHDRAMSSSESSSVEVAGDLAPSAFAALPLGSIRPQGWLYDQLRIQADGLSGHLGETWKDVGPSSGWLGGDGENDERGPYYLDGLVPLAYSLDDAALKQKAQAFIEWTLQSQQPNGMFGPKNRDDWWPRMVMLKALTQYQEASGDVRVIPFLTRYFHYQLQTLPAQPLESWGKFRWQDQVVSIAWLYNRTQEPYLIELAHLLHQQGHDWVSGFDRFQFSEPVNWEIIHQHGDNGGGDFALSAHGVNNGMAIKTGPVWYFFSKNPSDRDAARRALEKLDTYHGLPNGMFSCDEHLSGRSPEQGSELCTVVETMFSLEHAMTITGDPQFADRLEMLAFNPLPAAFTDDMWAHQYNQQPNQVECSVHTKPWSTDGPESNLFGLAPHFGCCTANFHQGWPKFTASLFLRSHDDGLVAVAFAPCEVTAIVRGQKVRLEQHTEYPFRDEIRIAISLERPLSFPISVRIPSWATNVQLRVNDEPLTPARPGSFARIERAWHSGDSISLRLPMRNRIVQGAENTVSLQRGPLVFSLPIGEDWLKLRDRGLTADWQVYPTTGWNYALSEKESEPEVQETVDRPIGKRPFAASDCRIGLKVKARKVPKWRAEDGNAVDLRNVSLSDVEASEEVVTLQPYATAKLRITAFPIAPAPTTESWK